MGSGLCFTGHFNWNLYFNRTNVVKYIKANKTVDNRYLGVVTCYLYNSRVLLKSGVQQNLRKKSSRVGIQKKVGIR